MNPGWFVEGDRGDECPSTLTPTLGLTSPDNAAGRSFAAKPRRLDGLRIGFSPDLGYAAVAGDVRAAFKHAIDALVDMGAELTAADPGVDPDVLEGVLKPIAFTEQAAAMSGAIRRSSRAPIRTIAT